MLPVMEYELPLQVRQTRLQERRRDLLRKLELCLIQAADDERYAHSLPSDSVHDPRLWAYYAAEEFAAALAFDKQIVRLDSLRIEVS